MDEQDINKSSCDPQLTRKEFLETVVKRAAITGALLAAPRVIDTFLIPPAAASASSCTAADTIVADPSDQGTGTPESDVITQNGIDTLCSGD